MGRTLKMKVSATNSALSLLSELQEKYGEKLMFHQSGGCCDGSAPMCFQEGEFPLGDNDVKLGEIGGVPFYMNGDQYENCLLYTSPSPRDKSSSRMPSSA